VSRLKRIAPILYDTLVDLKLMPYRAWDTPEALQAAIPAECLSVNDLLAVWPSIGLYGRAARKHIKQDSSRMRA
jgi:hypothetical protein